MEIIAFYGLGKPGLMDMNGFSVQGAGFMGIVALQTEEQPGFMEINGFLALGGAGFIEFSAVYQPDARIHGD